jgi:hypothetical protein
MVIIMATTMDHHIITIITMDHHIITMDRRIITMDRRIITTDRRIVTMDTTTTTTILMVRLHGDLLGTRKTIQALLLPLPRLLTRLTKTPQKTFRLQNTQTTWVRMATFVDLHRLQCGVADLGFTVPVDQQHLLQAHGAEEACGDT